MLSIGKSEEFQTRRKTLHNTRTHNRTCILFLFIFRIHTVTRTRHHLITLIEFSSFLITSYHTQGSVQVVTINLRKEYNTIFLKVISYKFLFFLPLRHCQLLKFLLCNKSRSHILLAFFLSHALFPSWKYFICISSHTPNQNYKKKSASAISSRSQQNHRSEQLRKADKRQEKKFEENHNY